MKAKTTYPRVIESHDWISIDFGNGRRLTSSYSGEKASGSIPPHVFKAWISFVDGYGKSDEASKAKPEDKPFLRAIERFAVEILPKWPGWDAPMPTFTVGQVVAFDFGARRGGKESGPVVKINRTSVTVRFPTQGLVSIPNDLLATGGAA